MTYRIAIDTPEEGTVRMTVSKNGEVVAVRDMPREGPVDNGLLTAIDNLFQEHILDRFASINVEPSQGIDRSSLLYRMVITLGAAFERGR